MAVPSRVHSLKSRALGLIVLAFLGAVGSGRADSSLHELPPAALGFDEVRLQRIDRAVDRAIAGGLIPGAVVLVGRRGAIAHVYVAGRRAAQPTSEPMTRDTIFDMASLTKPVVTATAVMLLIEEGKVRLADKVVKFLPEFDNHHKDRITVEHLLRHRAGFVPDNSLEDYAHGPAEAWKRIAALELVAPPGERFVYSDIGFLVLGKLVERVSGQTLDQFASDRIFRVIGMSDAHFRPILERSAEKRLPVGRIAPTERSEPEGEMLRGVVHDPRARAMGGVAGHAGLFATADDLAVFAATLMNRGAVPAGRRLLSPLAIRAMFDPGATPAGQRRGLGWDIETSFSSPRGELFGPGSLGHTGFTGTSLWIDTETKTFVVLLTSRLHPDGKKAAPTALRHEVATLAAAAIIDAPARRNDQDQTVIAAPEARHAGKVLCGIDVLENERFKPLQDQRLGLVTNHTGKTRDGRSTIDALFHAPGVKLIRLFSPEHGIRGDRDAVVADDRDQATGLPIVSLYGTKKRPLPADLADLDGLVFDIQDIGVRYYTYITTLGLVLEAVAESKKTLIVLDRPNPIDGQTVSGPVRDPDLGSFIAYHALPIRHGMTVGELAKLYNAERHLGARLVVVPCRGWSRDQTYDQTGLVWTNPSPNMRSLTEAMLYPGVGWLEATNLATGRGTDAPFERVGAPWIEPLAFAAALGAADVPGTRFVPIWFVPRERQYRGERCGGVQIIIVNWKEFDPMKLGLTLALALKAHYPAYWRPDAMLQMLGDRVTYEAILAGSRVAAIELLWKRELDEFLRIRKQYLIYDRDAP